MNKFEVEFYETENGDQPAKEFLMILDKKMRAKILSTIAVLQDNGYELRIKVGSDITRVLYFFYVDRHIILTNGFIKKTQKTPAGEIEKAKKYRADYLGRMKGDRL